MHGLNTRQAVNYIGPLLVYARAGQTVNSPFFAWVWATPYDLETMVFSGDPDLTREYYLKRLYATIWLSQQLPYICNMRKIVLRARRDIPYNSAEGWIGVNQMLQAIMNFNTVLPCTTPYYSPLTSPTLHKYFKIQQYKKFTMIPGKQYKFKMKARSSLFNKALTRETDGVTSGDIPAGTWLMKRGDKALILLPHGVPLANPYGVITTERTLSDLTINGVAHEYASWYNMDDTDDTNYIVAGSQTFGNREHPLYTSYPTLHQHAFMYRQGETSTNEPFWPKPTFVTLTNTWQDPLITEPTLGTSPGAPVYTQVPPP